MRVFDINGIRWTPEKFKAMGYRRSSVVSAESDRPLRDLTGLDSSRFKTTTVRVLSTSEIALAGERLGRRDWTTHLRRWCPVCLAQDRADESLGGRHPGWRYHRRFWWDLSCVRTCPIHNVRLESVCPTCKTDVTWMYGPVTTCLLGHSLLSCEPVPVDPAHARADAYIVGRLGGSPRVLAPVLDAWPLGEAINVMERLGIAAIGGASAWLKHIDPSRHAEMCSVGFEVAAGMPGALNALLDKLAERAGLGSWGVDSVYDNLVWWARKARKSDSGKMILDAILAHNARRTIVRTYSEAASFVDDRSPVSVSDISRASGKSEETVGRYLRAMGHWPKRTACGTPVLVSRAVMNELLALFEDSIGIIDAGSILGLHGTQVDKLVSAGILQRAGLHKSVQKRMGAFSRKSVEALMERIAGDAPFVDAVPLHLRPICGAGRNVDGGVALILSLILEGEGKVECRIAGQVGLQGLLIDPTAFRRRRRRVRTREIVDGGLNLREAAAILGLAQCTVSAAAEVKLLEQLEDNRRIIVAREGVLRFKSDYVSSVELARPLCTKPRHIIDLLEDAGVKPILSPKIHPRATCWLWRRDQIPTDLAERLRAKCPHAHVNEG
jgi:hypothetical protein